MKLDAEIKLNLRTEEVNKQVLEASRMAMRDTVVDVTHDSVQLSPWKTGNNRRSIAGEVSGMGMVSTGGQGGAERIVDDSEIEGAVYSTSGYGGYLETGTWKMQARPYFKPALDRTFTQEKFTQRIKKHL
jgi:hypothetical protein